MADTETGLCCNGGHGVAKSVVRGGNAAAVRTAYEMDPDRVQRPAVLASRVRGRGELRQAKVRAQCDREQVAGELKRSDDQRRREPSPRPQSSPRAQTGTVGIRGGVLKKGDKGGGSDGGRHALLATARLRKDKAREAGTAARAGAGRRASAS